MLKIVSAESARETLLRRLPLDETPVSPRVQARLRETFGEPIAPDEAVRRILRDVRLRGDAALLAWTQHLDGVALAPNQLAVEDTEIAAAYDRVDAEVVGALERAAERIRAFHARPVAQSWMMTELG
ncbi:MAG: histidinol dehydrogenase, partial [Thermoflexales bacterium]|nr:histidinol dehydrogenase [Thermoflexales bacterium]